MDSADSRVAARSARCTVPVGGPQTSRSSTARPASPTARRASSIVAGASGVGDTAAPARVLAEGRARGLGQVHGAAPRQTQLSQPIKGPVHGGDIVRQAHCCGQLLVVHRIAATLPGGNRLRHQQVPGVEAVKGPQGGRAGRKAFDQLGQVERAGLRQIGPGTQQDSQLLGVEGPDRVGKRTRRGAHREAPPDGASG